MKRHDWMFHCHILYHMMSGMARAFRYRTQANRSRWLGSDRATRGATRMHHGGLGEHATRHGADVPRGAASVQCRT